MGLINSFKSDVVEKIKSLCGGINPEKNISSYVKDILDEESVSILERLEAKDENVSSLNFSDVVTKYFNALDFCGDNIEDARLITVKDDIGNFFGYVDSLELDSSYNSFLVYEFFDRLSNYSTDSGSRGIYDLLRLDDIRNSKMVNYYLNNQDNLNGFELFVKEYFDFYNSLTDEQKDKFDYVFHSSSDTLYYFIEYPKELKVFFNENILDNFNKESLSLLFRSSSYVHYSKFFTADSRFLKVIAAMNKYLLDMTSHNSYFLDSVLPIFESGNLKSTYVGLFTEYYDKYFDSSLESGFKYGELFQELLSFSLSEDPLDFINEKCIFDLNDFFRSRRDVLTSLYSKAFGSQHILNIKYGLFDVDKDLIEYENDFKLRNLKKAFFYRVYGISVSEAMHIRSRYGEFLEKCQDKFLEEDKDTLSILKTICSICDLTVPDDNEKIRELQKGFYSYIKENGLYTVNKNASFMMLRSLIDKMYMKTYNDVLYEPDSNNVLFYQRGVPVIDAGVDFNMIVTSVNGVGDYFRKNENARLRYNSSDNSDNQGICATFINNENLGVIALNGPLLAFANLDDTSLNAMGIGDIYSDTCAINLKASNERIGEGNYFFTPHEFADNTRFGYNEMVLDRFLFNDDDNIIKVQPSYVVCYKIDENYKSTRMYKRSLRFAEEFNIPLVLVDVRKVKEHERDEILMMERELFDSDKVNKDLMLEILTRYMNNYTGSLTMIRTRSNRGNNWNYKRDFSILGMDRFVKKVLHKMEGMENDLDNVYEWYDALKECYMVEKERNLYAHSVSSYANSLEAKEFVLDDSIEFMDRINSFTGRLVDRYYMRNGLVDSNKISYNPRLEPIAEVDVIVNMSNYLFGHAFVKSEDAHGERIFLTSEASSLSDEEKSAYGIVISYLLGNFNDNYFSNLHTCDYSEIDYGNFIPGSSLMENLMKSDVYSPYIYKTPTLLKVAEKVDRMDEDDLRDIFKPVLKKVASERNLSEERVFTKILKRKCAVVQEVSRFPDIDIVNDKKVVNKK